MDDDDGQLPVLSAYPPHSIFPSRAATLFSRLFFVVSFSFHCFACPLPNPREDSFGRGGQQITLCHSRRSTFLPLILVVERLKTKVVHASLFIFVTTRGGFEGQ